MNKVISKDVTSIAYDKVGNGLPLILVDGALCYRASGPNTPLAAQLAQHFTVFTYDRRGRGESDEMKPYAVEREVEDIEAHDEVSKAFSIIILEKPAQLGRVIEISFQSSLVTRLLFV